MPISLQNFEGNTVGDLIAFLQEYDPTMGLVFQNRATLVAKAKADYLILRLDEPEESVDHDESAIDEISESELELVECIREQQAHTNDPFRLVVERRDGAWDVTLAHSHVEGLNTERGVGSTFAQAWDNRAPLGV